MISNAPSHKDRQSDRAEARLHERARRESF